MFGFLLDNIHVVFGDHVFKESVGIPMGTNCVSLLADLFLYSCEAMYGDIGKCRKPNLSVDCIDM